MVTDPRYDPGERKRKNEDSDTAPGIMGSIEVKVAVQVFILVLGMMGSRERKRGY